MRSATPRRPDVDRKRIGLASASLGSWVSVSVAARDRRVSAVVEYYGGLPEWEELDLTRLPPVLILHGDADRNVRVEEAYKLEQGSGHRASHMRCTSTPVPATGFAARIVMTRSSALSTSSSRT